MPKPSPLTPVCDKVTPRKGSGRKTAPEPAQGNDPAKRTLTASTAARTARSLALGQASVMPPVLPRTRIPYPATVRQQSKPRPAVRCRLVLERKTMPPVPRPHALPPCVATPIHSCSDRRQRYRFLTHAIPPCAASPIHSPAPQCLLTSAEEPEAGGLTRVGGCGVLGGAGGMAGRDSGGV